LRILILGIGNILFGDEGIGVHFINLLKEKYLFVSDFWMVDIIDGGTLAQRLIPIIVKYDEVIVIDCVSVEEGKVGDIFFFDFSDIPEEIKWQGSAHEVEMLQTLKMIEIAGDLPQVKILGVIPYVIGENSTFELSKKIIEATGFMEKIVIGYLEKKGIKAIKQKDVDIKEIAKISYKKGILNDT